MKKSCSRAAAALSSLLLAQCGVRNATEQTTTGDANTMTTMPLAVQKSLSVAEEWRRLMPSSSPDGDHTRSGRARSVLRVPAALVPVRSFERSRAAPPMDTAVSLSEQVIAADGVLIKTDDPAAPQLGYAGLPAFFPDGFTEGGQDSSMLPWYPWVKASRARFKATSGVRDAFARSPAMIVYVFQEAAVLRHPEADPPGHDGLPSHFGATVKTLRSNEEYISVAGFDLTGAEGGGAIGYDAKIALYTTEGRFIVLNFANSDQGSKDVDVSLDVRPSSLSITSAGYALLSGANGVNGPANHLQVLDDKGAVKWAVTLGFLAEQPAIDAGGGRLYLVGGGFAAVEDGKVLWSSVSSERVSAMAFSDGGLAMTVGTELRVLDRDGHVLARLRAPDGEILGRPAIGPDGAIWVASKTTLYVAR